METIFSRLPICLKSTLIIILLFLIVDSCSECKRKQAVTVSTKSEELNFNYIKLLSSYIDATFEWHHIKNYNIYFEVISSKDTLEYEIYAGSAQPIWPVNKEFKYCYFVENHYVFSNKKLFSQESLPTDKILKELDPKAYDDYKRTKQPQCPKVFWDSHSLKIQYINNHLISVSFDRQKI